jgi:hypothetical protein
MPRWLAQLEGARFDLEELPKWFPDGPIFAIEEDGAFYLVGPGLDILDDAQEVRSAAIAALDDYSGIIALLLSSFQKPRVGNVIREHEDGRRVTAYLLAAIGARSKLTATLTKVGDAEPPGPTQAQQLLAAAQTSPNLSVAILLWSEPERTWPRLYRVLEEVERGIGKTVDEAGLCLEGERERFKHSAQVPEVAGLDARHALGKSKPPANPMKRGDATAFIGRLLEAALRARA